MRIAIGLGALACLAAMTAAADGLQNAAQTTLGATATFTGAPNNKDWPANGAIPAEPKPGQRGGLRGGCMFGAPMENGTILVHLIVPCEIEHLGTSPGVETRDLFVQPGMRFCQAQALVDSLLRDDYFAGLDEAERELVTNRILEDVRGSMLEDIVLLETKRLAAPRDRVLKVVFEPVGEIDMLVYRAATGEVGLYEIKHATGRDVRQVRHLVNPKNRALVEKRYGKVTETAVLYRGKPAEERGVSYRNVNDYLKGVASIIRGKGRA